MSDRVAIEPFREPDGRITWAAREYVQEKGYYRCSIIRWFKTRAEGEAWLRAGGCGTTELYRSSESEIQSREGEQ